MIILILCKKIYYKNHNSVRRFCFFIISMSTNEEITRESIKSLILRLNTTISRETESIIKVGDKSLIIDLVKLLGEDQVCKKVLLTMKLVKDVSHSSNIFDRRVQEEIKVICRLMLDQMSKQEMIAQLTN